MAPQVFAQARIRFTALFVTLILCVSMSSPMSAVQADTPTISYPAEMTAIVPGYSLIGQVKYLPKSATLSASSKRLLASYITKLRSASKVQIKSFYTKPSERSTLIAKRSSAVMTFFISRGFVPTFSISKGTTSARKTQIFWIPSEISGQVNFTSPSIDPVTWKTPVGVKCLYFVVAGAQGGSGGASDPGYGGLVSFAQRAVPGQELNLYVGGVGGSTSFYEVSGGIGGTNGGGAGGSLTDSEGLGAGGGGGGWSGVFQGSTPIAVAGGGGGSASSADFHSGAGGDAGADGRDGAVLLDQSAGGPGGGSGTQILPGTPTDLLSLLNSDARYGESGVGRNGGSGAPSPLRGGGGGGGGYFGGAGGSYSGTDFGTSGGGGGGSNFVPAGGVAFVAPSAKDGSISIKYSNWNLGTCKA